MKLKKKAVCTIICMLLVSFSFAQNTDPVDDGLDAKKKINLSVSLGYNPGQLFDSSYIGSPFSPLGFNAQVTYIPLKKSFEHIGVELTTAWLRVEKEVNTYTLVTNAIPITVNFVYQFRFNDRLLLDSHVGLGLGIFSLQFEYDNGDTSPSSSELGFAINTGVALQVNIAKDFYAEIGIDYIIALPDNVVLQLFLPSISVGYQF